MTGIPVLAATSIDPGSARIEITLPEGLTVAQIVATTLPGLTHANMERCRVALVTPRGTAMILRADWHRVRPNPGVRVVIRLIPGNEGLKAILSIVVSIAAVALGATFGLPFATALGITGSGAAAIGGAIITALDLLDRHHEVSDPVTRPDGQDLRGKLCGGVDPAGIGAQPEGAVEQLEVAGALRQGEVELVGAVLVVVILLGHPAGEVSAAERDRGDLPAGDARLLPAAARLGVTCERNRKYERRRQQRKGNGSHTCHMFG